MTLYPRRNARTICRVVRSTHVLSEFQAPADARSGRARSAVRSQCMMLDQSLVLAFAFEKLLRDLRPFLIERGVADRLACAAIPIGGVAGIALLAMQIGVNPVALPALVRLRRVMRAVPIPPRVEPKRPQSGPHVRRRLSRRERGAEGSQIHDGTPISSRSREDAPRRRS